jgi:hypothetical protein
MNTTKLVPKTVFLLGPCKVVIRKTIGAHNIKMDLREIGWSGMDWIDLARTRKWTFGFHKMLQSVWVAERLAASQEGLSSMRLARSFNCISVPLCIAAICPISELSLRVCLGDVSSDCGHTADCSEVAFSESDTKWRLRCRLGLLLISGAFSDIMTWRAGTVVAERPAQVSTFWNIRRESDGWSCDYESALHPAEGPTAVWPQLRHSQVFLVCLNRNIYLDHDCICWNDGRYIFSPL